MKGIISIGLWFSCACLVYAQEIDFIFADFQLDNQPTNIEVDLATSDYKHYYISLARFNDAFVAALSWDKESQEIQGDFWDGPVRLSLAETPKRFLEEDGEVYFDIALLSEFSIEYQFDVHRQVLRVLTQGKHPKTHALQVEKHKDVLRKIKEKKEKTLEIGNHYQLGTTPLLDLSVASRLEQNDFSSSFFSQSVFDLLYHQADIQLNLRQEQDLNGRAVLTRKVPYKGQRLRYEIGDIQSIRQSLLNVPSRGVGINFGSGRTLGQRNNIDVTGFTQPNSEVELFRDGVLIDFVQLGEDGFYLFEDLDLRDPTVVYQLKVTTPDGQQQEKAILRPGEDGLQAGHWRPSVLFLDSTGSLFGQNAIGLEQRLLAADFTYADHVGNRWQFGVERLIAERENQSLVFSGVRFTVGQSIKNHLRVGYADKLLYDFESSYSIEGHSVILSANQILNNSESQAQRVQPQISSIAPPLLQRSHKTE